MDKSIYYVGVEGSYKSFDIALFDGSECIDEMCNSEAVAPGDIRASSQFLLSLQNILVKNNRKFSDLSFLAVNHGPGAFTSLRVIIATVNAIAFREEIKLVSVDGLDALECESGRIPILNAYNNDVYYSAYGDRGYKKIDLLLPELVQALRNRGEQAVSFAGNGANIHKALIQEYFKDVEISPIENCSAKQVGIMGFEFWNRGERIVDELRPAYLKEQTYAVKQ